MFWIQPVFCGANLDTQPMGRQSAGCAGFQLDGLVVELAMVTRPATTAATRTTGGNDSSEVDSSEHDSSEHENDLAHSESTPPPGIHPRRQILPTCGLRDFHPLSDSRKARRSERKGRNLSQSSTDESSKDESSKDGTPPKCRRRLSAAAVAMGMGLRITVA